MHPRLCGGGLHFVNPPYDLPWQNAPSDLRVPSRRRDEPWRGRSTWQWVEQVVKTHHTFTNGDRWVSLQLSCCVWRTNLPSPMSRSTRSAKSMAFLIGRRGQKGVVGFMYRPTSAISRVLATGGGAAGLLANRNGRRWVAKRFFTYQSG